MRRGDEMIRDTPLKHLHAIELPTPFPVGPVIVYLADAPGEPLTLIDTGPRTPDAHAALETHLDTLGHRLADLKRILVTHAHADHYGLAADLVAASDAQVCAHPWNIASLGDYWAERERRVSFYSRILKEAAVPKEVMLTVGRVTRGMDHFAQQVNVDTPLQEGERLRLAGRDWAVLHTPGHAAGLICLYESTSQLLLSSDHLLADISSNPVVEPPPPGETERPRSLVLYCSSLQRVATLNIDQALPGHGPVIHDVAQLVSQRLDFHQRRLDRVMDSLRHSARTTWQITEALFPERTPLDTFLAVSEVIGHLDVLEMDGRIAGQKINGVFRWAVTA
jgi:glyoxylase-like metal-dependent hydrolase (beta-lactamase superfamily II)